MVSCQKGPTRHAYAWQIAPFWQDTLDICCSISTGQSCKKYPSTTELNPHKEDRILTKHNKVWKIYITFWMSILRRHTFNMSHKICHLFVVLCFVVVSVLVYLFHALTYNFQGRFKSAGVIIWLPQGQYDNCSSSEIPPKGNGYDKLDLTTR